MPSLRLSGIKILGAVFSVLLVFAGVLLLRGSTPVIGLALILVGVLGFLFLASQIQKHPIPEEDLDTLKPFWMPAAWTTLSLLLSALSIYSLEDNQQYSFRDYRTSLFWVASVISLLLAILWRENWRDWWKNRKGWWQAHWREVTLILTLGLLALGTRLLLLGQHPFPWSGDEASIGTEGMMILQGTKTNLFATGWSGQPNWSFLADALALALVGKSIASIRVISAITGALSIIFTYLFARRAFNRQVAFIAAAFLVTYPLHLHFSRLAVHNITDSLMITLVMWLLLIAIQADWTPAYGLAGIASGLALYTYVGTRLVIALALCVLIYASLAKRGYFRSHLPQFGLFFLALAMAIAPMAYYFGKHPDIFMTRIGQEGIFLNGWLANHAAETGTTSFQVLLQQISRSTLVFISPSHPALGIFYNSPRPYLTIAGAVFALIGMGFVFLGLDFNIKRIFDMPNAMLLGWFWSVVILGGILTLNPPANTRMIMTTPAVAIFIGLGIWLVGQVLARIKISMRAIQILSLAFLALLTYQNLAFYFGEYRTKGYFQDPNSELAEAVGLQLQELGPKYDYFYFFGMPRMFANFPTIEFLAPDVIKTDLIDETTSMVHIPAGEGALFVSTPENQASLEQLSLAYPGGTWMSVPRDNGEEILYYAYVLPPTDRPRP